jgi:hypothetical protein
MFSNYFEENWGDASRSILLREISDGYMEGNHFSRNTSAIYMYMLFLLVASFSVFSLEDNSSRGF